MKTFFISSGFTVPSTFEESDRISVFGVFLSRTNTNFSLTVFAGFFEIYLKRIAVMSSNLKRICLPVTITINYGDLKVAEVFLVLSPRKQRTNPSGHYETKPRNDVCLSLES